MAAVAATVSSTTTQNLALSITNPLVLYRALLATQRIKHDPAQHRLALELQKLYYRLKDYNPEIEYRWRLERAAKLSRRGSRDAAEDGRKAVFNDGPTSKGFSMSRLFSREGQTANLLAMTRTIPLHSSALEIDSPQGMLLYGEVGRGKSMLIDLLYSSLPTKKKRRWHFNTFILDIFRRLELARIERTASRDALSLEHEHVVLSLARETMETSPILFLDEFQMPDRVSGKLVNSFMTAFFSMGGVLVASSNRMPEELAKASGVEFSRLGGGQAKKLSIGQQQARNDFGIFVDVLKKRCEVWEMEGQKDWRREDGEIPASVFEDPTSEELSKEDATTILDSLDAEPLQAPSSPIIQPQKSSDTPTHYHISDPPTQESQTATTSSGLSSDIISLLNMPSDEPIPWQPTTLTVYARKLNLTLTLPDAGVAHLPFPSLCQANLGPADYISICSAFHTLIVTQIPILTLLMKNEARRFITFLDACYEARVRLIIEAAAPPDRLFFPETRARSGPANGLSDSGSNEAIDSEAFSEMYQDSTAPFRPNISSYVGVNELERQSPEYNLASNHPSGSTTSTLNPDLRSILADEDADFGPTYGNKRSNSGMTNAADWDSDGSDLNTMGTNVHISEADRKRLYPTRGPGAGMAELELRQGPDFTQGAGVFTGQDEQFAYKRARSRLWELCGRRWWEARTGEPATWWMPVHKEGRFWEARLRPASTVHASAANMTDSLVPGEGLGVQRTYDDTVDGSHMGGKRRIDENLRQETTDQDHGLFRHGASPFRTSSEPPPKFGWQHAWGMMRWGKKAGEWGKGVEGVRPGKEDEKKKDGE